MYSKVMSGKVHGIDGILIQVEADVSDGLPMFDMVGYLGSEVKEARERVKISLKNSGYRLYPKRITVNLSPANIRKEGTAFDLPIAIAILISQGYLMQEYLKRVLIVGELSLDGEIHRVNGILPIVIAAKRQGIKTCLVPADNSKEAVVVQGIDVIGVSSLEQAIRYLSGSVHIEPEDTLAFLSSSNQNSFDVDFSDVGGQFAAKRAVEIAVAGMHNILMIGTPGSGKTMIAKRIPTIMPELTLEEAIELSKIYSVSGLLEKNHSFIQKRPFRSPHHTITTTALAGGGRIPKPGEISLANGGILFLDELPEFQRTAIEVLRQPLEEKYISLSRVQGVYRYPADFMLVAAMNPCKCGYYPDRSRCRCTLPQIRRYMSRISGPLLDRIDISIEVNQVKYEELKNSSGAENSAAMKQRIDKARKLQKERYKQETVICNGQLSASQIKVFCKLGKREQELLKQTFSKYQLSARAYYKILKVSRTIADLDESREITTGHLSEAVAYRCLDRHDLEE